MQRLEMPKSSHDSLLDRYDTDNSGRSLMLMIRYEVTADVYDMLHAAEAWEATNDMPCALCQTSSNYGNQFHLLHPGGFSADNEGPTSPVTFPVTPCVARSQKIARLIADFAFEGCGCCAWQRGGFATLAGAG